MEELRIYIKKKCADLKNYSEEIFNQQGQKMSDSSSYSELKKLREDFDNRVDILNEEAENKLRSLEERHLQGIEDLRVVSATIIIVKIEFIAALKEQIQRLVASENINEDCPEEFLRLKRYFTEKFQEEIAHLKLQHDEEIVRLKEHVKKLNGRGSSLTPAMILKYIEIRFNSIHEKFGWDPQH